MSQQHLTKLTEFKKWMKEGFKNHCKETYGNDVYNLYIHRYKEDFLEAVEFHLEDLQEQVLHNEDFIDESF